MRDIAKPILRGLGVYRPVRRLYRRAKTRYDDWKRSDTEILEKELVPEAELKRCLREAVSLLSHGTERRPLGDYLEFGVYNGRSLSCMYQVAVELGHDTMRFFGFDSFQGFPPDADMDDKGTWIPGYFKCPRHVTESFLDQRNVDWSRVTLVEGWFNDTLNDAAIRKHEIREASVIMIDCDMYSSTACALRFVEPLIRKEAVILFDDWSWNGLDADGLGEKKAFDEFLLAHEDLRARETGSYNENSLVFHVERKG